MGVAPLTVIVSSTAPTFMSALMLAANEPVSSMPSRFTVLKPVSVNETEYVPGRRLTIRDWPVPSETAERVFSMRAGLETSTVTPGNTAPDVSFTTPVIDACANATAGNRTRHANMPNVLTALTTLPPEIERDYTNQERKVMPRLTGCQRPDDVFTEINRLNSDIWMLWDRNCLWKHIGIQHRNDPDDDHQQ